MGQGSALSPILSALYLASILHILEKCLKILKIPISILSFVDNGLFVAQSKFFTISNSHLFCSYNITSNLLKSFGLTMKYSKTEVFYFSRLHEYFDSLSLDLSILGGPIPCPGDTWKYLDFIFDRKLMFCQHINFYVNKAISMVKCMKILGNSTCGLISHQKQLLYPLKELRKMQRRASFWILSTFQTLPSLGIKALAGFIPIYLHLQKLNGKSQLRAHTISCNHILCLLLESRPNTNINYYYLSLYSLTRC